MSITGILTAEPDETPDPFDYDAAAAFYRTDRGLVLTAARGAFAAAHGTLRALLGAHLGTEHRPGPPVNPASGVSQHRNSIGRLY